MVDGLGNLVRLLVREGWWRPEHMTARCLREGRDIVGEVAFIMTDQWKIDGDLSLDPLVKVT